MKNFKNIIIVGSSSGLGKAMVGLLESGENRLFLLNRSKLKHKTSAKNTTEIYCDISSFESIEAAFKIIDKFSRHIDVLINCAGIGLEKELQNTKNEEIKSVIDTNLLGTILVSKEAYKRMIKNKSGYIINVSSTSGKKARDNETVYCASKWGLAGFTESLRLEAKKFNIKVSTIFPAGMKTNFYRNNLGKDTTGFMNPNAVAKAILNLISSNDSFCISEMTIEKI